MASTYTATDAAAYERLMGRWSRLLAPLFIDFADVAPGDRILDMGCGTGSLAFALVARDEPSRVVGVDIAKPYVAHARNLAGRARSRLDRRRSPRGGSGIADNSNDLY